MLRALSAISNSEKTILAVLFYHAIYFWLDGPTKGSVEDRLREVDDMVWYTSAEHKCCEVIGEVIAVVGEDIVSLVNKLAGLRHGRGNDLPREYRSASAILCSPE